ncbi:iron-sulfur cluster carrier protein ApbC [Fodinicurvata sp. EGI_FJ10296]|uniref:iron-sulfur cluster carrier protein ApbC n=1 Tax=Fodinicurvata sp. EGI_FJ10296 TaxID=3231908 RepID=UPI003453D657
MATTDSDIRTVLATIEDPDHGGNIVDRGMVSAILPNDDGAQIILEVEAGRADRLSSLQTRVEDAVKTALPHLAKVTVIMTAERSAGAEDANRPQRQAAPSGPAPRPGASGNGPQAGAERRTMAPDVRHIIAVASGKGGVGKSTVAANLALGLQRLGLSVGVLDADIYGPSMPRMLGVTGKPASPDGKTLDPMENHGLKIMSIGFMIEEETPMIWRGPMVQSALQQMLRDVNWGPLDVLVIDMPPGTGDAQLTLAQQVPLSGAVIVSTPQDIALLDARKGLNMFRKVDVPVFGIVENMSYFVCSNCGAQHDVFGHGGARREAERLGIPFLGEIPLHLAIRETSDGGTPVVVSNPEGEHAYAFVSIAELVRDTLEGNTTGAKPAPKIVYV